MIDFFNIKDTKRSENFKVKGRTDLLKAFELLRQNEIEYAQKAVDELASELALEITNGVGDEVKIRPLVSWGFEEL